MPVGLEPQGGGCGKLMEHSWWRNPYVGQVTELLRLAPMQVAWVGQYAKDVGCDPALYNAAHGENSQSIRLAYKPSFLDGKFLVNISKKEYVDCDAYKKRSIQKDGFSIHPRWCVHPLPLLTAIGNGLGCGDYSNPENTDIEYVGRWANDIISVEECRPFFCEELVCTFIEAN